MPRLPVYVVDAFTDEPFRGNAAGVVLDGGSLPRERLQDIAAELKHSETVFVGGARDPAASFHLRWFTPIDEVRFCGHATLAAIHVLVEESQRLRVPSRGVVRTAFSCLSGVLPIELFREADGRLRVRFQAPRARFAPHVLGEALLAALGLQAEQLDPVCLPRRSGASHADEGNSYLCVRERSALAGLRVDGRALQAALAADQLAGVAVFHRKPEPGIDAALRCFFPGYLPAGVGEDPVTGSASAQLACLLQELFPEELPRALRFTQGSELGRTGHAEVEVRPEETPGEVRAWVGGRATTVLRGELELGARP
jgi:PhzF family phenazine biosynthesis protein